MCAFTWTIVYVCFWNSLLLLTRFLLKMQKTTFLKINGFEVKYFIKSKYRRIQIGLVILKNIKHLIFFKRFFFLHIFKKSQFSEIFFYKSPVAHGKLTVNDYFM